MIGMDSASFLTLLIISLVVSWVLHYPLKYYVTPGLWSYCSKVVVGWFGAWLGSPVFGHWWPGVQVGDVYIVPAVLGAAAMLIVAIDLLKIACGGRGK